MLALIDVKSSATKTAAYEIRKCLLRMFLMTAYRICVVG